MEDEDYYSESETTTEEESSSKALIPKSMVPEGFEIGDTLTLRITKSYQDEVEVELVSKEKESVSGGEVTVDDEIDAMDRM